MSTSISIRTDLEDWYTLYAPRLRRATRRIVGNEHDAEDAIQDAFIAALRAHDRYRPDSDPYPWLFRIATRKALNIVAGHRHADRHDGGTAADAAASAEDEVVARDAAWRVERLVATEISVKLHLIDGLRFRDIGERLGISPATAATRIRRGKRRLRELLGATFASQATPAANQRSQSA